jgi:Domain of unknown function (DUF4214)
VQTLLALNGKDFIQFLFQFALGRTPLDYEVSHFSNQLELGIDKYSIVEQFFSSEEHKIWQDSRQLSENRAYISPAVLMQNQPGGNSAAPVASEIPVDQVKKAGIIESILFAKKAE